MTVKIITDSTSDLTPEIATELGITVVPLYVHFGSDVFRDGIDITTEYFYEQLATAKTLPTTSAPSPGDFARVYDKLAEEAEEILVITISTKLSATYNAAIEAKEQRKSTNRLEVIDSRSAISGLGLITVSAAKAAKAGAGIDEVIEKVRESMRLIDIRIAFDTLEYLRKGGRIGTAQAFFGSALKINPILTIRDGATAGIARVRCRPKAIDYLYDFAASFPEISEIALDDASSPDEAEKLIDRLSSVIPKERIYRMKVSPVIGTHVGPHVLGIAIIPKQKS